MFNLNFLNWLFKLGYQCTIEFIYFLFKDYLKRDFIEKTDRVIIISRLEASIVYALRY